MDGRTIYVTPACLSDARRAAGRVAKREFAPIIIKYCKINLLTWLIHEFLPPRSRQWSDPPSGGLKGTKK